MGITTRPRAPCTTPEENEEISIWLQSLDIQPQPRGNESQPPSNEASMVIEDEDNDEESDCPNYFDWEKEDERRLFRERIDRFAATLALDDDDDEIELECDTKKKDTITIETWSAQERAEWLVNRSAQERAEWLVALGLTP
jgi:hypothetical protein